MQRFIQVPRLSHSSALFLSPGNEVGRLFKLPAQKVNEDGGGGGRKGGVGFLARVSQIKLDPS